MIQLTESKKRTNKKGIEVDATVYLDKIDDNNLILKQGEDTLAYFGDVRTALKRSLNYIVKGSEDELTLIRVLQQIIYLDNAINELK